MQDWGIPEDQRRALRRVGRILLFTLSILWAVWWLLSAVAVALLNDSGTGPAVLTLVGVAPCLPYWIYLGTRYRRWKAARAAGGGTTPQPAGSAAQTSDPEPQADAEPVAVPAAVRDEWERVIAARDLVHGFAEDGWIEPAAVREVDRYVAQLERLLVADARTEQLGGRPSATLRQQVSDLRALLVALADAAVEHQASLAGDDPVPVTLAEARQRISLSTEAYRKLQSPG